MSQTKQEEQMATSASYVNGTIGELIYRGYDIHSVQVARSINSEASSRGAVGEILVCNYKPASQKSLPATQLYARSA